jgi:hypothetical protein
MDGGLDGCIEEYIMSAIQGAGGQPQKSPRYAPIYTGRVFNGLYTNRSPLRGSTSALMETFYKLSYGDVMIAGSNVEVSNRLTLIRRPGNPEFSSNVYSSVQNFNEFRVNKAAADVFGLTLEEIFVIISEPGALYAEMNGVQQLVFSDPAVTSQFYSEAVGNELYFTNGIDNKKWLQSLNTWSPNFQLQGTTGLQGTYPFFTTYLVTGPAVSATENVQVIQELYGIAVAKVTNVALSGGVLTLTIATTGNPTDADGKSFPLDLTTPTFQIWGVETATWLNGATITAQQAVTIGMTTYVTAAFVSSAAGVSYGPTADTGYLQQIGSTPVIAETGSTEPTWGTFANYVPNTSDSWGALVANGGNFVLDGNLLWVNRGSDVENWGIAAPGQVTTTESGSSSGWRPNTWYSAPGVVIDTTNKNIWQLTTAGTTATGSFSFPSSPSVGDPHTDGTAVWTCVNNSATYAWSAHTDYCDGTYTGVAPWTADVTIDGVTYPAGQFLPNWSTGSFIVANGCLFELQRNVPGANVFDPNGITSPVDVPISAVFDGGASVDAGWTVQYFNSVGPSGGAGYADLDFSGTVGSPIFYGGGAATPAGSVNELSSVLWDIAGNYAETPLNLYSLNNAGQVGATSNPIPYTADFQFLQYGAIRIPTPYMTVSFQVYLSYGGFFGIEGFGPGGPTLLSFTTTTPGGTNLSGVPQTSTPWNGYPVVAGSNLYPGAGVVITAVVQFTDAGVYGIEFAFGHGNSSLYSYFACIANGSHIVPEASVGTPAVGNLTTAGRFFESATTQPAFPASTPASASINTYPNVTDILPMNPTAGVLFNVTSTTPINGNQVAWFNLGPVANFAWPSNTPVTLPSLSPGITTEIIDSTPNYEAPYFTGTSGTTQPAIWSTTLYGLTSDASTLTWIQEGTVPYTPVVTGKITATTGWYYWIALVNTLDDTVSNAGPVSLITGPVQNGQITIPAGSGITLSTLDPQVDYVAIFRSTDGGPIPILNPGFGNSIWTVPLTQYLQNGFIDSTPDIDLDTEIEGAIAGENTPPLPGVVGLVTHLGRGFYAIGNTVYYTSGPDAPSGNGNGTSPLNFDVLPSRVLRLVPTAIGLLVYTVSDIYIIAGNGTATSPILPAVPYLQGIGLANYNALDINGTLIGFFTTDKQFVIFDPSAGLSYVGYPIGDQFRLNNGLPGTSWNIATVSVAWYTSGEDQAWFIADGEYGWFKLIATPAPETGNSWSPFANIGLVNPSMTGISVVASIETSPGVHNLLIGPSGTGNILTRNLDATTDGGTTGSNGVTYPAYGVFGSYVLALPGQIAKIAFITTVSVRTGSPLVIGLLIDEALPYYKGSFDILKRWETDPPNVPESKSFYKQRFYLSDDDEYTAYCSDIQIMVQWPAEAAQNELQTFTVWGAYEVEQ